MMAKQGKALAPTRRSALADAGAGPGGGAVLAPISVGELFDKITILEIKVKRITDSAKQFNVLSELRLLRDVREREVVRSPVLDCLTAELKQVNDSLWRIEDDIRDCERQGELGLRFVQLARSVYRTNDRRAQLKRQINELSGSRIIEEKSYNDY
jgi:Family of unknown function (DUF6165)